MALLPNPGMVIPGMPVEAFIETGERTVLSYLLQPLVDQLNRAMRED
jgi:HlyD family secretion protein